MDSVRFGRALGIGARSAAKALAGAVEAAAAPNPRRPAQPSRPPASVAESAGETLRRPIASAAKTAARAAVNLRETRKGITRGSKRFGESVWGPFAKLSRVLWLEMTGFFFGIFAAFAGQAVWANRAGFWAVLHPAPDNYDARTHLLVFLVMALAFGYFCISSFVRAYRR